LFRLLKAHGFKKGRSKKRYVPLSVHPRIFGPSLSCVRGCRNCRGNTLWSHAGFSRDSVEHDRTAFQGKDAEASALPTPPVDSGDAAGTNTLLRKSLRVSSRPPPPAPTPALAADKTWKNESFPQQIHMFVTAMMSSDPAMITFTDDGDKIQVREDHPDLGDVLEANFCNPRLGFFSQSLLGYGWSRDSDPKYVPLAIGLRQPNSRQWHRTPHLASPLLL
jgi:hypothetical protein